MDKETGYFLFLLSILTEAENAIMPPPPTTEGEGFGSDAVGVGVHVASFCTLSPEPMGGF